MSVLSCIGVGNMGAAILRSVVSAGLFPASALVLCDAIEEKCLPFVAQGATYTKDAAEAVRRADILLVAVKPQNLADLGAAVGSLTAGKLVISICAGVTLGRLAELFPVAHLVRVMPNTPLMVGAGVSGLAFGADVTDAEKETAQKIFAAGGLGFELPEEKMNALTAITSSSIAYFAQMIEQMTAWAVANGFDEAEASAWITQAAAGTCAILQKTEHTPTSLRIAVTSPHGTTEAALNVMRNEDIEGTLDRALDACRDRAAELGK